MDYIVAVLSNQIQAEAAYSALAKEGLPSDQIDLLGDGYQSADDYGLIHPNEAARIGANRQLYWLVSFGFIAGYAFNWLTAIEIIPAIDPIANHFIGGLFGAVAGAQEVGDREIVVNTVTPGPTVPGMFDRLPPEFQQQAADSSPFNRVGTPQDIADVVAFLVSEEARWISGQEICVNGGAKI